MKQYLETLDQIKGSGTFKPAARAGMPDTIQQFGKMMQIDLSEGFPLYTSKKLSMSNIMHELNWFIKGHTSVKYLEYHKCRIWHDDSYSYYKKIADVVLLEINTFFDALVNSNYSEPVNEYYDASELLLKGLFVLEDKEHRLLTKSEYKQKLKDWGDKVRVKGEITSEHLDALVVETTANGIDRDTFNKALSLITFEQHEYYDLGDCGAQYGYLWRNLLTVDRDGNVQRVDQFSELVKSLQDNPYGRRHIINSWNVGTLNEMALNACHPIVQYDVTKKDGKDVLSCAFFMRSNDMFLGNPYNIAFYALLTNVLAGMLGFEVGTLTYFCGDSHIYADHVEQVTELLERTPRDIPKFDYKALGEYNINDILSSKHSDHRIPWRNIDYPNGEIIFNGFDEKLQKHIVSLLTGYDPHPAIKANLSTGN